MTTKCNFLRCALLGAASFLIQSASAFYDSGLGRWISRDPIEEKGGSNLYGFVSNTPTRFVDSLGLDIWVCIRPAEDIPNANHTYFWDDVSESACSRQDKSVAGGGGKTEKPELDVGPEKGGNCTRVEGSKGRENAVMDCCNQTANAGPWIPWITDCHNRLNDCLSGQNPPLRPPPHPRWHPSQPPWLPHVPPKGTWIIYGK